MHETDCDCFPLCSEERFDYLDRILLRESYELAVGAHEISTITSILTSAQGNWAEVWPQCPAHPYEIARYSESDFSAWLFIELLYILCHDDTGLTLRLVCAADERNEVNPTEKK